MSETSGKKNNPLIAAAAIALILFSAVGVAVMTGLIPNSKSSSDAVSQEDQAVVNAPHKRTSPAAAPRRDTPAAVPAQVAASSICVDCGVIEAVNVVAQKGEGSGLGAAGGAVIGGLIGHQVGNGRGNTAATVVGAVGGAMAGNEVEKRVKTTKHYNVAVRMDNGAVRNFPFEGAPGYSVGEKVRVVDGQLVKS